MGEWLGMEWLTTGALNAVLHVMHVGPGLLGFDGVGVSAAGQQGLQRPTYPTVEQAALAAVEIAFRATDRDKWEYGGRVCKVGPNQYQHAMRTSFLPSNVSTPSTMCRSLPVKARFHAHRPSPNSDGIWPSGFVSTYNDDLFLADRDALEGHVDYWKGPLDGVSVATHITKYCRTGPQPNPGEPTPYDNQARLHMFERSGNAWVKVLVTIPVVIPPAEDPGVTIEPRPWPVAVGCVPLE